MSHFSPPLSPLSSPTSPPFSPVNRGNLVSPVSGVNHSHKDVLTELMSSMEGLNFNDGSPISAAKARNMNMPWLDVPLNYEDQHQQQFILSPSAQTLTRSNVGKCSTFSSKFFSNNEDKVVGADINGSSCPSPDLGWVNELLM